MQNMNGVVVDMSQTQAGWSIWLMAGTRVDQNTGSALLEFSIRTAKHGTSLVKSAIFVCDN